MSKIGKIFRFATDPLGLFKKKKKQFVVLPSPKPAEKTADEVDQQTSELEVAERRLRTANRLRSGRTTIADSDDEEEEAIRRVGARRAKLLGS